MSTDYIPGFRYSSDTDTVEVIGDGSRMATAAREATHTDAPVSGVAPESGLNAALNRAAFLREQVSKFTHLPDGRKVPVIDPYKFESYTKELAALESSTIPYQREVAEKLKAQYAANLAERDARLRQESETRDALEARAAEIAFEREAEKQATRMQRDLHLDK